MADKQLIDQVENCQERIEALEARNAFQDDVIEQLNQELAVHQKELADLQYQMQYLASRLKDMSPSVLGKQSDEPPPPHY